MIPQTPHPHPTTFDYHFGQSELYSEVLDRANCTVKFGANCTVKSLHVHVHRDVATPLLLVLLLRLRDC